MIILGLIIRGALDVSWTGSVASILLLSLVHELLRVGRHRLSPTCLASQRAAFDVSALNILPIAAVTASDVQNTKPERRYRQSKLWQPLN